MSQNSLGWLRERRHIERVVNGYSVRQLRLQVSSVLQATRVPDYAAVVGYQASTGSANTEEPTI